ncbi:MAG: ATP phosphoribosyltransferase regulatory subunit [Pseudomonadota bacterium]
MSALFGSQTLDRVSKAISEKFGEVGGERISLQTVQPLVPFLEFLGEAYRRNIIEHGDGDLCLCPDLTLALALAIASGDMKIGSYNFDGLVFRGSRVDRTASPVQRQIGFEIFSTPANINDDSRIVLASIEALNAAQMEDFKLVFADLGLVFAVIDSFDVHPNWKRRLKKSFSMPATFERDLLDAQNSEKVSALPRALVDLTEEDAKDALADVFSMLKISPFGARSLDDIASRLIDKASEADMPLKVEDADLLRQICEIEGDIDVAFAELNTLLKHRNEDVIARIGQLQNMFGTLHESGVSFSGAQFNANLGRELSYYDGFVFECHAPDGTVLGGGGRYDGLLSSLSQEKISSGAVGAMLRPDRIAAILDGAA